MPPVHMYCMCSVNVEPFTLHDGLLDIIASKHTSLETTTAVNKRI